MPNADYDIYDAAQDEAANPRTCLECGVATRHLVWCKACGSVLCRECLEVPCQEAEGAHVAVTS